MLILFEVLAGVLCGYLYGIHVARTVLRPRIARAFEAGRLDAIRYVEMGG